MRRFWDSECGYILRIILVLGGVCGLVMYLCKDLDVPHPDHKFRVGDLVVILSDDRPAEVTSLGHHTTDVYVRVWVEGRGYVLERMEERSLALRKKQEDRP